MATFSDAKAQLLQALKDSLRVVGVETQKYFQEQIDKQSDVKGRPYEKRNYEMRTQKGKKILKDQNNLYDSIEVLEIDFAAMNVTVGIDTNGITEYAEIHNEGGKIVVTEKMKAFFWAKYYETEGKQSTNKKGERRQNKANKELSQDALFWRAMALKKVGDVVKIPQRQFIGESSELQALLEQALQDYLDSINL